MILAFFLLSIILSFSPSPSSSLQTPNDRTTNQSVFSLPSHRRSRALETSQHLDASRFHFQILFVDDNNSHGRIAEGALARIAEHNDAMFVLFPSSATIDSSPRSPVDAAAPEAAVTVCKNLGFCPTTSGAMGTGFGPDCLDGYDLVVSTNEEVQRRIMGSLSVEEQGLYGPKCRVLEEFLSCDFCNVHTQSRRGAEGGSNGGTMGNDVLLDMLDPNLYERAALFAAPINVSITSGDTLLSPSTLTQADLDMPRMILSSNGAAVPNTYGWPLREAAVLLASAGVVRFCLDTMDHQMEAAFQELLDGHFKCRWEDLECGFGEADERLRRGSFGVTGYFSPEQRRERFERHVECLRLRLVDGE